MNLMVNSRKSETVMMPNLPEEMVEEILSRVPAPSLKRFRSTCKGWIALFKDPGFIEKHLGKAAKHSMILMLKEFRVCSVSINLNVAPPSIEIKGPFGLKDDIYRVFHCDGLLLCTTRKDRRPLICNPCLGETKWIQLKTGGYEEATRFALGYQNKESCRSYKILRYWGNFRSKKEPFINQCEIYELSSDTWQVLYDINLKCFILHDAGVVSLKGNFYCLAQDYDCGKFLLCFDFTSERFIRMSLPPSSLSRTCFGLSIFREERLSLLHQSFDENDMEIWVTNKFDSETALLWTKSFTLDLCFRVSSGLLVDEEKKLAVCYSPSRKKVYTVGEDNEYYTELPLMESTGNPWLCSSLFSYVPSLVQIQQGRGKRKERS